MERQELEDWRSDLKQIAGLLANPDLRTLLESPRLSLKDKMLLLKGSLKVKTLALNLAGVLVARGRLGLAQGIVEEYERLLLAHYGIEEVEVITAIPLEERERETLIDRLSQILGKKISLHSRIDPNIIGGLIVRTEGLLINGSTKSKLEALRRDLIEARR
jgi:F-type H+-transporting ATPase subunit delta